MIKNEGLCEMKLGVVKGVNSDCCDRSVEAEMFDGSIEYYCRKCGENCAIYTPKVAHNRNYTNSSHNSSNNKKESGE